MRGWKTTLLVLCSAFLFAAGGPLRAEVTADPPSRNRQVAFYVNHFLGAQHLSRRALDDEVSKRLLKSFVEGLDPLKLYFLQSDVAGFQKNETELDDMLRRLDTRFAHDVFRVFQERVQQRTAWAEELLQENLDFEVDEEITVDAEQLSYAANDQEARERWRRRVKYDLLVLKLNNTVGEEAIKTLRERYTNNVRRTSQTDDDELLERYMNALTTSYDPHSSYFSPGSFEDFRIRLGLNYQGIGAELEERNGFAVIRRIMPGGAAEKAGELKANDKIVSVGQGDAGPLVDVVEMKLDDIIDMIRGREGTIVRLGVITEGDPEAKIYKITRARIELKDSQASGAVFEHGKQADGSPYKIGFIDLPSFYMDMDAARHGDDQYTSSTRDVRRILDDFREKGVQAVVVDLRRNGGGSLTEAIGITGLFIDQGPVVQVKDSRGNVEVQSDVESGVAWDGPLVVLISRFSASASEILAGAIQDYGRGVIVGDESTHGKGTVQTLLEVGPTVMKFENSVNLGAIKITMQQFYRPNGDSTQSRGVLADVILPSLSTEISKGEKELDYAVAFDHVPAATFARLPGKVEPAILESLRNKSQSRREKSEDFQKLDEQIARYVEDSARKTLPLNEQKFMELRKRSDAERTEREEFEHTTENNGIRRDFYVDEVLLITADYLAALRGENVAAR
jgi:carboxyl-terminal processing protease